jgi:hypothetical protein
MRRRIAFWRLGKAFAEGSEENEESKSALKNLRYLRFLLL